MEIIKIVNSQKKYVAKNGKEYANVNYYIKLENKKLVPIRPSFAKDYSTLDAVATLIINGK